jgi:hypothetical protein
MKPGGPLQGLGLVFTALLLLNLQGCLFGASVYGESSGEIVEEVPPPAEEDEDDEDDEEVTIPNEPGVANCSAGAGHNTFALATSLGSSLPLQARGTTVGATLETDEPPGIELATASGSVWWTWTPPHSGTYVISTANSINIDSVVPFDPLLAVYTGSTVDDLTFFSENDDENLNVGFSSRIVDTFTAGTTYRIRLDQWVNTNDEYRLDIYEEGGSRCGNNLSFALSSLSSPESVKQLVFVVNLDAPATDAVSATVELHGLDSGNSGNSEDITHGARTLSFAAGEISKSLAFSVNPDGLVEGSGSEEFIIVLSNVRFGGVSNPGYGVGLNRYLTLTLQDSTVPNPFCGGNGGPATPWLICSAFDLISISNNTDAVANDMNDDYKISDAVAHVRSLTTLIFPFTIPGFPSARRRQPSRELSMGITRRWSASIWTT